MQYIDLYSQPCRFAAADGKHFLAKIDLFFLGGGYCALGGWASSRIAVSLTANGKPLQDITFARFSRPDVNELLECDPAQNMGWAIAAPCQGDESLALVLEDHACAWRAEIPLDADCARRNFSEYMAGALGGKIYNFLARSARGDDELELASRCHLDCAALLLSAPCGNILLLCGSLHLPDGAHLALENEMTEESLPLEPYFIGNSQPAEYLDAAGGICFSGRPFLIVKADVKPDAARMALMARRGDARVKLAEPDFEVFLTFNAFMARLFTLPIAANELAASYDYLLGNGLACAQARHMAHINALPAREMRAGRLPSAPDASVIVPLYGESSLELVPVQLMLFSEDQEFKSSAELIYVLDDPALATAFDSMAHSLSALYGLPLRWLARGRNAGFASACNCGARHARGQNLIFLNSDVFPERPGWLAAFRGSLQDPQAGLAGCCLLRADGSIQHAGMAFRWLPHLRIWSNYQPEEGLGPEYADAVNAALCGACIGIRRDVFQSQGGFGEDYIGGDFEDSDFCLKIIQAKLKLVYMPDIRLTHLGRQSMDAATGADCSTRRAICNGVIQMRKWRIAAPGEDA